MVDGTDAGDPGDPSGMVKVEPGKVIIDWAMHVGLVVNRRRPRWAGISSCVLQYALRWRSKYARHAADAHGMCTPSLASLR